MCHLRMWTPSGTASLSGAPGSQRATAQRRPPLGGRHPNCAPEVKGYTEPGAGGQKCVNTAADPGAAQRWIFSMGRKIQSCLFCLKEQRPRRWAAGPPRGAGRNLKSVHHVNPSQVVTGRTFLSIHTWEASVPFLRICRRKYLLGASGARAGARGHVTGPLPNPNSVLTPKPCVREPEASPSPQSNRVLHHPNAGSFGLSFYLPHTKG